MAVIQKIRDKYGKVAGAVIAISLVSFIISDARNGSFGSLFGGQETNVMTVNGEKIESREYEKRVKEYETLTQIYSTRGAAISEEQRAQIREQVLQMMAYETTVNEYCDKLGINVSEQEKKDMIYGQNAHPLVRQFTYGGQPIFNNENNQFDPGRVKGIEEQISKNPKADPYGKFMEDWSAVKEYVVRNARVDKFNTMVSAGMYTPVYETKRLLKNQQSVASIKYVKVPYTAVADAEVKITEDDLNKYMQKHKPLFETDQNARTVEYVSFDIIPASADSMRAAQALEEMKAEFSTAKDNKTFVSNKTDEMSVYSEAYVSKKTFSSRFADTLMAQPVGAIFGPYVDNNSYRITKIVDKRVLPDSAKSRHILVKIKEQGKEFRTDSAAKQKIDSIVAALNAGANFDTLVAKFSEDEGSKATKGEYWFNLQQRPGISKTFADFVFEGKVGEKKIVKADNTETGGYVGYHYVEILEQKGEGPTVQMATIVKTLAPSDSTADAIYGRANDFAGKSADGAAFDANVKKMGLDKRVGENLHEGSFMVPGLGAARDVVRWTYEHKIGEVSTNPFRLGDQRYVVAKLVSIDEKGKLSLSPANRPTIEQKVREEKKAEAIRNKYKGASLDAIATATGVLVQQTDSVNGGAPYIPGLGFEPKVAGYVFSPSMVPNSVSNGIAGQGGVYFITLLGKTTNPGSPTDEMNAMMQRAQKEQQLRGYASQLLQPTVIKRAKIEYNMKNF